MGCAESRTKDKPEKQEKQFSDKEVQTDDLLYCPPSWTEPLQDSQVFVFSPGKVNIAPYFQSEESNITKVTADTHPFDEEPVYSDAEDEVYFESFPELQSCSEPFVWEVMEYLPDLLKSKDWQEVLSQDNLLLSYSDGSIFNQEQPMFKAEFTFSKNLPLKHAVEAVLLRRSIGSVSSFEGELQSGCVISYSKRFNGQSVSFKDKLTTVKEDNAIIGVVSPQVSEGFAQTIFGVTVIEKDEEALNVVLVEQKDPKVPKDTDFYQRTLQEMSATVRQINSYFRRSTF